MKFLKVLGVLAGMVLLMFIATLIGFEFFKPFVMPYMSGGIATDIESVARPLAPLEQLVMGGAFLVILNWVFGLSKWLHKGINLLVNAPLAIAAMAVSIYGGYSAYLVQEVPNIERLGLLGSLFVLSLFWLLISVKVNILGKHLFQPKDWDARKKAVIDIIEKVEDDLDITEDKEEEVKV